MDSTPAMAIFLRYWRSKWAGLSRAQLALSIAAHCRRHRVTEAVIREWERGQPPASTEELDALLAVMRKHGLSEFELEYVRRAVFAACLDRHYPELFAAEEFAQRPDVDEEAERSLGKWPQSPASRNPVELVAQFQSLLQAVGRDIEPAPPGSQRRRQQVALAFTRETMNWYCGITDRRALGVGHLAANLRFLEDCFGPGGVGYCTIRDTRRDLLHATGWLTREDEPVLGLLEMSRQAEAAGNGWGAADLFATGLGYASTELRSALWPQVDRHLANTPIILDGGLVPAVWDRVFGSAVTDGKWALAESIVPRMEPMWHINDWSRQYMHRYMGHFAFLRGDLDEAEEYFAAGLEINQELGGAHEVLLMPLWLRACEQARKRPGYDPVQLDEQVWREIKRITRARREWAGRGKV